MSSTATQTTSSTSAAVLSELRGHKADRDAAEIRILQSTIEWAVMHEVDEDQDHAHHGFFGDRPIPLAGVGAPLVSEFAAMEYAAALGMSTDAGHHYLGRALELRYRLPRLWQRVMSGQLPVWRAGRVSEHTMTLPAAGAAYVDRHLAPVAHSCSWAQLDRVVEEALVRFDPETAEQKRREASERRHFDIQIDRVSYDGTVHVDGELGLADALDLEDAVRADAKQQAALGSTEPLDVRRSIAVGNLARCQPAFDLDTEEPAGRSVVLYAHVAEGPVARCGNTRTPISVEQIKQWCADATRVVVKPVIDLNDHIHVEAYEVPGRLKQQNELIDLHCVFPHCTRSAARCDYDHVVPHAQSGPTCSNNTAPLCRRHHRAKTHSPWTYRVLDRGTYLWTTPHGIQLIRDHHGTHSLAAEP